VLDGDLARERLSRARLMLLYTPALCPEGAEPLAVLERALPHVDVVQVRIKDPDLGVTPARALADEARRVLALVAAAGLETLVLENDRVDVAAALAPAGLAGVHLGDRDAPPDLARAVLGPGALIGLSTHAHADVVRAEDAPVD
jgi:thiamine-phosphate pyrophosphorylase